MINGFEYAFEDIQIAINGQLFDVQSIKYGYGKEHTNIKGRSGRVVAMGRGAKGPKEDNELVLLFSDYLAIDKAVPEGKDVTDGVYTISVAFAPEGGQITTRLLKYVRFKEWEEGMKQGDDHMEVTLPFIYGEIEKS